MKLTSPFEMIPPIENAQIFADVRVQPPHRGHVHYVKQMLHLGGQMNDVVLAMGLSPSDQAFQVEAIVQRLGISSDKRSEIENLLNDKSVVGKSLVVELEKYSCNEEAIKSAKTRIDSYRKVFCKPLTDAVIRDFQKNPFTISQRERLLRLHLNTQENEHLTVISTMTAKPFRHGATHIALFSGEEYALRATIFYDQDGIYWSSESNWSKADEYDMVIVLPRDDIKTLSGTILREHFNNFIWCIDNNGAMITNPLEQAMKLLISSEEDEKLYDEIYKYIANGCRDDISNIDFKKELIYHKYDIGLIKMLRIVKKYISR